MTYIRKLGIIAMVSVLFAGMGVASVTAQTAVDPTDPLETTEASLQERATLRPISSEDGGITTEASSPANCIGKANNPHESSTGGVKGVTQTDCDYAVSILIAESQLWRHRWWGYEKVGAPGENTNYWDDQVKASATYIVCEENDWRTEGDHWSYESGIWYYRHTMNYEWVDCT